MRDYNSASDEQLVDWAKEGDKDAFAEVYERYKEPIWGYIFKKSKNQQTAGDVVQETFVNFLENIQSYRHQGRLVAYLYTAAHNAFINMLNTRNKSVAAYVQQRGARSQSGENAYDHALKLIETLPEPEQEIMRLRSLRGVHEADIALAMQMPPGTIKTKIRDALRMLKETAKKMDFS